MSEIYDATYSAVAARIGHPDIAEAIRSACNIDASWAIEHVKSEFISAAVSMQEPSAIYRPSLSIDGNQWCALYGENLQDGVAGFGDSPALAISAFNKAWVQKLGGGA